MSEKLRVIEIAERISSHTVGRKFDIIVAASKQTKIFTKRML